MSQEKKKPVAVMRLSRISNRISVDAEECEEIIHIDCYIIQSFFAPSETWYYSEWCGLLTSRSNERTIPNWNWMNKQTNEQSSAYRSHWVSQTWFWEVSSAHSTWTVTVFGVCLWDQLVAIPLDASQWSLFMMKWRRFWFHHSLTPSRQAFSHSIAWQHRISAPFG